MQKEYNFQEIEEKWQAVWEKTEPYKVPVENASKNKAYVLDMFPYPSGSGLHMGHPLGYTGTDIYSRFKRLQGFSVLHPMGFDAFGLPAEQHAIRTGNHPAEFTKKNCEVFKKQLKRLGFSYDWEREVATCDPEYYQWTQWIFLKIYNSWFDEASQKARPITELPIPSEITKAGKKAIQEYRDSFRLAYMDYAMVNWCPELGTVLSNEEVIDGKSEVGSFDVIRKPMRQWLLRITKYSERLIEDLPTLNWPESIKDQQRNWIGRRYGAEIDFKVKGKETKLTAFTTRPDTLFGVTFFVISPEHPLVEALTTTEQKIAVKNYCDQASKLSDLSRTIENREKTGVFTGTYLVNPINQAEVPLYIGDYVLMNYGTGAVMGVPAHDERDFEFAKKFNVEIIPVIVPEDQDLAKLVLTKELCWTESGKMISIDYPVFKELALSNKHNELAKTSICEWLEKQQQGKQVVNYRLRDWLFSRQRYWGEPIPIIHWEDGSITGLEDDQLPLVLPEVADYKPSTDGESPLAKAENWLEVICPKTGQKGRRETNTMPQWAGSCWYYLRFIDPKNSTLPWAKDLEQSWMNVDLYVGGAEHAVLHLLYARFWHKILFDLGFVSTNEPFQRLFNQGMLTSYAYKDSRGALVAVDEVNTNDAGEFIQISSGEKVERITAKMSKSLRNVVTPDEIINEYGADTLRTFLMFMAPLEAQKSWDSQAITGVNRFLRKAYGFVANRLDFVSVEEEDLLVKKALAALIQKITLDLENLRFNTPVSSMMEFLNNTSQLKFSKESASLFAILLSPYAPHLAEEIWNLLGNANSVTSAKWPSFDPELLQQETINVVIQVNGKKRANLEVDIKIDEEILKQMIVENLKDSLHPVSLTDRFILVKNPKDGSVKLANVIVS